LTDGTQIVWPTPGNTITRETGMVYTIGQQINQGGYALVFEGMDLFGNSVALKIFKPADRKIEEVQEHWNRETKLFKKLRHPSVVAIYDAFICGGLFYIVLERAWGNLCDWVTAVKTVPELTVREIARQLLFAVHFIHREGVLQRDITIYNTLVFEGPQSRGAIFKISDFGISRDLLEPWSSGPNAEPIAHPCFVPPEFLVSEYGYGNEQSDLYHLGLVLLYCHTGSLPLNESLGQDELQRRTKDGIPRIEAEKIGTPLGNFISVLLRRHQDYRFKTALEAWNALKAV
jgi:eukaryotic-like serine/threonine-protein kinase